MNKKRNIDCFIDYFKKQGFVIISVGYELGRVDMEHSDGRFVQMFVNGTGMDFTIKGYSFNN